MGDGIRRVELQSVPVRLLGSFPVPLAAEADQRQYPPGNLFPSAGEFRSQFVSFDGGNFQLSAKSAWRKAGTDGNRGC